jgi:hypothetical protein
MGRSASSGPIFDERNDILRWIPYSRLTSMSCEAGRSNGDKDSCRLRILAGASVIQAAKNRMRDNMSELLDPCARRILPERHDDECRFVAL